MNYQIGDKCELEVIDICSNTSGYDYLYVIDNEGTTFKIHNILKCQYNSVPNTVYGIVRGFNSDGTVRMAQDEPRVLQEHYTLRHQSLVRNTKTSNSTNFDKLTNHGKVTRLLSPVRYVQRQADR